MILGTIAVDINRYIPFAADQLLPSGHTATGDEPDETGRIQKVHGKGLLQGGETGSGRVAMRDCVIRKTYWMMDRNMNQMCY